MSTIKDIKLEDGTIIFVEMDEVALPIAIDQTDIDDLPKGATLTGASEKIVDTLLTLKDTLRGIFNTIHTSFTDNAPDEWGAEINIGFKGKTNPIPIIVSTEANVAIKVHAKWVRH